MDEIEPTKTDLAIDQAGRSVDEKVEFDKLIDKVVTSEVLVGRDFNGHVGSGYG